MTTWCEGAFSWYKEVWCRALNVLWLDKRGIMTCSPIVLPLVLPGVND
jgi:hypothetical protein